MAETKAVNITILDTPGKMVQTATQGAPLRHVSDTVEAPILALNDTVRLLRVHADAVLNTLSLATDDLGTTGTLSLGIAYPTYYGSGATIVANTFATSLDVNTAAVAMTDRRFTNLDINTINKKIWELAGLTSKPSCAELDIVLTATAATTAAGTITGRATYAHI